MISGLPIGGGERVRTVLIKRSGTNNGAGILCHPFSGWSPVSPPLPGKYDDYGQCEFDKGYKEVLDFTLKALNNVHVPVEQGENEYHDIAIPDLLSEQNLKEGLRTGRILLKNSYPPGTTSPMTAVFIREDVWNALLSIEPPESEWNKSRTYKDTQKMAHDWFRPWHGVAPHSERCLRLRIKFDLSGFHFPGLFSSEGYSAIIRQEFLLTMRENLMKNVWNPENPTFKLLLQGFVELAWVGDMMYAPMRAWHPVATSGQDHDLAACKVFYEKILAVTTERWREREEDR